MPSATELKNFLDGLVADPRLKAVYNDDGDLMRTFCNVGARDAAQCCGCNEFYNPDLLADDMIGIMQANRSGKWAQVEGLLASNWAQKGGLAFAGKTSTELGEKHGHIAAIYVAPMEKSGSLDAWVPLCANIGKGDKNGNNFIGLVTAAFPVAKGEPTYWTWGE